MTLQMGKNQLMEEHVVCKYLLIEQGQTKNIQSWQNRVNKNVL